MRYLPFVLLLALTIYALVDCVRNDDTDMPVDLPKPVWVFLIVLLPPIGPIAWLVVSRVGRAQQQPRPVAFGTPGGYRPPLRPTRPRPVAPDDDPEFLASLNTPEPPTGDARTDGDGGEDAGGTASPDEPGDDGRDSGPTSSQGPSARS